MSSIVVSSPVGEVDERQLAVDRLLVLAHLVLLRLGVRRPTRRASCESAENAGCAPNAIVLVVPSATLVTRRSFSPLVRVIAVGEPAAVRRQPAAIAGRRQPLPLAEIRRRRRRQRRRLGEQRQRERRAARASFENLLRHLHVHADLAVDELGHRDVAGDAGELIRGDACRASSRRRGSRSSPGWRSSSPWRDPRRSPC